MNFKSYMNSVQFILIFCLTSTVVLAATTHKHIIDKSKERIEDGIFKVRDDSNHYDPHGKHNIEFDHEAIIGSVKEAEEYDQLSPDESKKRLAILVIKMDLNSDHYIDRHELKAWILRSFKMLSEEEANSRFDDIDTNEDHKISITEYIHDTYELESDDDNDAFNEEAKLIADDKQLFIAADFDKDGLLNPMEFVKFLTPEEHPEMLPIILEQTLRDKDINKDSKISFQEFVGDGAKDRQKDWLIAEKVKFDEEFDKDGDGFLNGNEILSWIVPSNDEVAQEETDHLFAVADSDSDDRLSYEEVIENYDIFVGSEATDYGDHLHNIHSFKDEL